MAKYFVEQIGHKFWVFDKLVDRIENPTMKVKDWFYAKEITNIVPDGSWTHILAVVKETEKAVQIITQNSTRDGDDAGWLFWCPKSCIEAIEQ